MYDKKYFEYEKYLQLNKIKKMYPLFDDNKKHYILWIIPDIYYNYYNVDVFGEVKLIKNNGNDELISICTRKPYPNKNYHQMALKNRNKKCFGIPLLFNSFYEISNIKEIIINWDIYDLVNLNISSVIFKYRINFNEIISNDEENNFYTLHSLFTPHNPIYSLLDLNLRNKIKEYDYSIATAVSYVRDIYNDLDKSTKHIYETFAPFKGIKNKEIISLLDNIEYNKNSIYKSVLNCPDKYEVEWNKYYLEKNITLNCKPLANICLGNVD